MERPSWAPIVFAGALPKGLADALAMTIIGLMSLESSMIPTRLASLRVGLWILLLTVPPTCALASLSDTARKLREELALFAYGGSSWHVWLRYFIRGLACTLIGISPFLSLEYTTVNDSVPFTILSAALVLTVGGIFYAVPSLRRMHSRDFAENYKG